MKAKRKRNDAAAYYKSRIQHWSKDEALRGAMYDGRDIRLFAKAETRAAFGKGEARW